MNTIEQNKTLSEFIPSKSLKEITCIPGSEYSIDGIRVICIREGNAISFSDSILYNLPHTGQSPIFVDKNHDLSYYICGSDYYNEDEDSTNINSGRKYGFEWGSYQTEVLINNQDIGMGLYNTNALMTMDLKPTTSNWTTIWEAVKQFRETYSPNWFVPTIEELRLIYSYKSNLVNISTQSPNDKYWYFSSSEKNPNTARGIRMDIGEDNDAYKMRHGGRVRLCVTL